MDDSTAADTTADETMAEEVSVTLRTFYIDVFFLGLTALSPITLAVFLIAKSLWSNVGVLVDLKYLCYPFGDKAWVSF
jgi:hypothetical protein